jgi:tetrahydromethanopterin S-methyltransferase subunit B
MAMAMPGILNSAKEFCASLSIRSIEVLSCCWPNANEHAKQNTAMWNSFFMPQTYGFLIGLILICLLLYI